MIKKYDLVDDVVIWQPQKCFHSAVCIKTLPQVFNPSRIPWVKVDNADPDMVKEAVRKCPSGALTLQSDSQHNDKNQEASHVGETHIKVSVIPNGPILLDGLTELVHGNQLITLQSTKSFLCRCGQSSNKPFGDGTHSKIGFKD